MAGFMILLDFYVFQIIRSVSHTASPKTRSIIFITYWTISILALVVLFLIPLLNPLFGIDNYNKSVRGMIFAVIIILFFAKLVASVFFLIDDIRRGIQWIAGKTFFKNTEAEMVQGAAD